MSNVLYLLTGPTGVGKTALALQWAEANNAEILSCDSLLFYKGMDIGTATPSIKEQMQIKKILAERNDGNLEELQILRTEESNNGLTVFVTL